MKLRKRVTSSWGGLCHLPVAFTEQGSMKKTISAGDFKPNGEMERTSHSPS